MILERLDTFMNRIDRGALEAAARSLSDVPPKQAAHMVETYLNEVPVGLKIIAPHLSAGIRILEIGSGIGVLATFLRNEGFDVTGIEPGDDGGFDFMGGLQGAVAAQLSNAAQPEFLKLRAEDLTPEAHGTFDLIFSANVLEHIMTLRDAVPAMRAVLAPGGVMRHLCPNYSFPYEPHLGLPLVPFAPQTTRHLFPRTIKRHQGIWNGVNFITARRIEALARQNGLSIAFDRGVMGGYMRRLAEDPTFAERHARSAGGIARKSGLVPIFARILDALPPRLASPMVLTMRHA